MQFSSDLMYVSCKAPKNLNPVPSLYTMIGEVSTVGHFCFCMWCIVQINQAKYSILMSAIVMRTFT